MKLADPIVNVTSAAALYSQVAGLLAGFAFTALMVFLTRSADSSTADDGGASRQRENATALSLTATLIAFVIISVLYAILAGGPPKSGAGYLGIVIYGAAFALSVLSVFHSLALVASSRPGLRQVVNITRLWTAVIGPTVSMLLISSAALDIFFYRYGQNADTVTQLQPPRPFGVGLILTALMAASSLFIFRTLRSRDTASSRWISAPNTIVLVVSLLAAAGAVLLLLQPADFRPSNGLVISILCTIFAVILTFSVSTTLALPAPAEPIGKPEMKGYRHGNCPVQHRSPETAARCRNA